jgi:hypothetical protein
MAVSILWASITFIVSGVPRNHFEVFEKFVKKERARTAATPAAAAEFSQSIRVTSSTHPGTTYPVRTIPHSNVA